MGVELVRLRETEVVQACAHAGLGHAHNTLGNPALAQEHYQHALAIYTDLGLSEADKVGADLQACRRLPAPR
jgi:hypothetical protein